MERKQHLDSTAVVILLGCCVLWGLNQVAAKAALTEIGPLWQAALRSGLAGALVWGFAAARGIALFRRDGSLPGGLLAGLLFAAEFACIFVGLQYTTASRMVVFLYLSPFVVALGMPLISPAERLTKRQAAGLLIAFGAVAFAFGEGLHGTGQTLQWLGDALGVLAALLWGGTTLAIRATKLSSASAEKTLLYQLAISAIALAARLVLAPAGAVRLPGGDRVVRELPAVVLADPPLPGDQAVQLHLEHAAVRSHRWRAAARRADHPAPDARARRAGGGDRDGESLRALRTR